MITKIKKCPKCHKMKMLTQRIYDERGSLEEKYEYCSCGYIYDWSFEEPYNSYFENVRKTKDIKFLKKQ